MLDLQGFEPIQEDSRNASTTLRELFRETVPEVRESGDEGKTSMKSAVELAKDFKTSDRSIQNWYGIVTTAYSWLPEAELKTGTGKNTRYTALCIAKMGELKAARDAGQTANDWIASIQQQNAEAIAAYQSQQQPEAPIPQAGQLATTEVVEDEPTISAIARVRENRYYVPDSGSNRLARAQETRQSQRFNLNDTRQRVQQAFLGLAVQTHENQQAKEIEREADKEQTFEEAYADELERIQIENAARETARADYAAFQKQVRMGNVPAPTASSASV
jgi:hypothetical protein